MTGRLWRHTDFLKLWLGQSISDVGSAITSLALPLVAIVTLDIGASEMGLLRALEHTPTLLFGLFIGVWVDRARRRPLMIVAQLGRAVLLAIIPIAALLGSLRIELLYGVGFLVGTLAVIFNLTVTSFLPTVVGRADLVEGNAKLQMSSSVASIGGKGLAGVLVQHITAPLAIVLDALSFLLAAICLLFMCSSEAIKNHPPGNRGVGREIGQGLSLVFRDPILLSMIVGTTIASFGGAIQQTVLILYLTRELMIGPAWLGIILASASIASLLGAIVAGPAARRYGPGLTLIGALFIESIGMGLIPFAGKARGFIMPGLILAQLLIGAGLTVYSINQISLRQTITPDDLLGRVNASRRVLVFGVVPIGALVGGALGEMIGLQATLVAATAVIFLSFVFHLASPLRGYKLGQRSMAL